MINKMRVAGFGLRVPCYFMRRYLFKVLIFVFFNFQLPVWASDWTSFGGDPGNTRYVKDKVTPPVEETWSLGLNSLVLSSPVFYEDRVFVCTNNGEVMAVDAMEGKFLWNFWAPDGIVSTPALWKGRLYLADKGGRIYCLNTSTGGLEWYINLYDALHSSPLIVDGILYIGTGFPGTRIIALDIEGGETLWEYPSGQVTFSSPAYSYGRVYIGLNNGSYLGLDSVTGIPDFTFNTKGGVYYSSPVIGNGSILLLPGRMDTSLYNVDLLTGEQVSVLTPFVDASEALTEPQLSPQRANRPSPLPPSEVELLRRTGVPRPSVSHFDPSYIYKARHGLLHTEVRSKKSGVGNPNPEFLAPRRVPKGENLIVPSDSNHTSSPAYANGTVFFVEGSDILYIFAYNLETGEMMWKQGLGKSMSYGIIPSPLVVGDKVVVGTSDGRLVIMEGESGGLIEELNLDGPIAASPIPGGGHVFIVTTKGTLYGFSGKE